MLNETQREYVENVRGQSVSTKDVVKALSEVELDVYKRTSFRELLFALDSLNLLRGQEWAELFIDGLVENGGYLNKGELHPESLAEIGQWNVNYGTGCYGMALVIDLVGKASKSPINSDSFIRRVIREYFFGLNPVDDNGLFALKRYFDTKDRMSEKDLDTALHVIEETKGLENDERWAAYAVNLVMEHVSKSSLKTVEKRVIMKIQNCNEIVDVEKGLIRRLKDEGVRLPAQLLQQIDLSRDQLLGLS